MARMDLFHGTRSGAVSEDLKAPRWLSAALVDGDGEDAAAMLVSVVERSFEASPAAREEFSAAVVRHYSEELSLKFAMERADLVPADPKRIEVFGSVRQENQVRRVLVTAVAGEGRHSVITFSAPSGRWEQFAPKARA